MKKNKSDSNDSLMKWIIAMVIVLLLDAWLVGMPAFDWFQKKQEIITLKKSNASLEKIVSSLQEEEKNQKLKFDEVSEPSLRKEKQLFPEKIDVAKISRLMELFTLQLAVLNSDLNCMIDSVSFQKTLSQKNKRYFTTTVSIGFAGSEESLKDFLLYIQSADLPEKFADGFDKGRIDNSAYIFLQTNLLPLANIQSINIFDDKDEKIKKAKIVVDFYSQS